MNTFEYALSTKLQFIVFILLLIVESICKSNLWFFISFTPKAKQKQQQINSNFQSFDAHWECVVWHLKSNWLAIKKLTMQMAWSTFDIYEQSLLTQQFIQYIFACTNFSWAIFAFHHQNQIDFFSKYAETFCRTQKHKYFILHTHTHTHEHITHEHKLLLELSSKHFHIFIDIEDDENRKKNTCGENYKLLYQIKIEYFTIFGWNRYHPHYALARYRKWKHCRHVDYDVLS